MKLSDVLSVVGRGELQKDCEFDQLVLFNTEWDPEKRKVAFIGGPSFIPDFLTVDLAGVICTEEVKDLIKDIFHGGILTGENPKGIFFTFYNHLLLKKNEEKEITPVIIGKKCRIHETAIIASQNVVIGSNVTIGPFTVIEEDTKIADNVTIGAHCVIGSPAFFYYEEEDVNRVVNVGGVHIGRNSEIHNHCVIAKAVFSGNTTIGDNVKLDNYTFVAHDVQIGNKTLVAAGTVLAGYSKIEDNVFVGIQGSITPNRKIGGHATVSAGAVITKDVEPNTHVSGNFAIEHSKFIKNLKGTM